jgi:hypothetical protein
MKGDFDKLERIQFTRKQRKKLSSLIGLIVVCIKENGIGFPHQIESTIKKGKKYTVINAAKSSTYSSQFYYQLISDEGKEFGWILSEHFIPLSKIREEKLNELGI